MTLFKNKILYFFLAFLIFLFLPTTKFDSIDGLMYLTTAKSVVYEGDFSVEEKVPSLRQGTDGKFYSVGGLGWTLALVIPIWINKTIGGGIENVEFAASFTNPFLAFCLLIVLSKLYYLISKNKKVSLIIAFIVVFTTNLLPLAKHSFAHMLSILAVSTAVYFGLKYSQTKKTRDLILSGVFSGLLGISYNYSFVLISFSLFLILIIQKSLNKKIILNWLLGAIPFIIILFSYNYFRFGNILESGYGINLNTGDNLLKASFFDGVWGILLSSGKSLWVYSPILIYSFYLAINNFKKNWVDLLFLIILVVNVLFYSRLPFWSGETSYGPRYFSIIIPFGGLVLARHWERVNKKILLFLVVIGLWVQLVGVSIPYTQHYPWYEMEFMCVGSQGLSRRGELDYWTISHFIPRYSPPYRLKRKLIESWTNLILKRDGDLPDFWWLKNKN